jgi:hypothetical protein
MPFFLNPTAIALTAPSRWVGTACAADGGGPCGIPGAPAQHAAGGGSRYTWGVYRARPRRLWGDVGGPGKCSGVFGTAGHQPTATSIHCGFCCEA